MPPDTTETRDIKRRLIALLRDYPIDSRLPSERDLAGTMGVAPLTINRAMRELAWEGYVRRIPRKGTFLASHERTVTHDAQTGAVGGRAVVFAYPNYFSMTAWTRLREAETQSLQQGASLIEFKLNPETSYQQLATLVRSRDDVCGLLLLPVPDSLRRPEIALLDDLGCPVVILSTCSEYVACSANLWAVSTDWQRAGYLKARALLDKGHRRIAYVRHEPDSASRKHLLKGMRQALRDVGLSVRCLTVAGGDTAPWKSSREAGYRICLELLARGDVTGLVFDSVAGVEGALRAAHERRLRVPEDVSIVSTGSGTERDEYFVPPLTTVVSDAAEEVRLALECVAHPETAIVRTRCLSPVLIERTSVHALSPVEASSAFRPSHGIHDDSEHSPE